MMDSSKMCFFIAALVLTAIAFLKDVKSEGTSPQICTNRVSGFPTAPEKGGSCNWQVKGGSSALNLRDQPSTTSTIISRYPTATILDNLGCPNAEGRIGAMFSSWVKTREFM